MDEPAVTDLLNELLVEEQANLAARLLESTLFVSRLAVEDLSVVHRIAESSRQHCEWLTQLILDLGDAPWPPQPDMRSADLHFQDLHCVLSRLAHDIEGRLRAFKPAAEQARNQPEAVELITKVQDRHRRNLASLRKAIVETSTQAEV